MKLVIIIALAFVLLVPVTTFAQEGSRDMMEEYCLKNLQDDPQCENYTPKKVEEKKVNELPAKIESNKTSNPFEEFIKFILQIFQGISPEETVKEVSKGLSLDSLEKSIEGISDSVSVDLDDLGVTQKTYSESELKQMAIDWNYNDILRNIVDYRGKIIHLQGPIHRTEQISDDKFRFLVLTNTCVACYHDYVMIDHVGSGFVNDDVVEIWGTVERVNNLPTLFGAEQLMPVIKSIKINCVQCR